MRSSPDATGPGTPSPGPFVRMGDGPSLSYWPWFLLATPAPLPERLLGADPEAVLDHAFDTWSDCPEAIEERSRVEYRRAMTPATIAAMCGDYRASFHLDREDDAADRHAGRRITVPVLVVTGDAETQLADAPDVWRAWTSDPEATTVARWPLHPRRSTVTTRRAARRLSAPGGTSERRVSAIGPGDKTGDSLPPCPRCVRLCVSLAPIDLGLPAPRPGTPVYDPYRRNDTTSWRPIARTWTQMWRVEELVRADEPLATGSAEPSRKARRVSRRRSSCSR